MYLAIKSWSLIKHNCHYFKQHNKSSKKITHRCKAKSTNNFITKCKYFPWNMCFLWQSGKVSFKHVFISWKCRRMHGIHSFVLGGCAHFCLKLFHCLKLCRICPRLSTAPRAVHIRWLSFTLDERFYQFPLLHKKVLNLHIYQPYTCAQQVP